MNNKTIDQYNTFLEHYRNISYLESTINLLIWDQEVLMPKKGAEIRSKIVGNISAEIHMLKNSIEFKTLLQALQDNLEKLGNVEARNIQKYIETVSNDWKISVELAKSIAEATSIAQIKWMEAKEKNNYALFSPYFEKIIELKKEIAKQINSNKNPYDVLLQEYEPDVSSSEFDDLFDEVLPSLMKLRNKLLTKEKSNELIVMNTKYQYELVEKMIEKIGFSFSSGRLDIGEHPATEKIHDNDIRIIASFNEKNINKGLFLTLHEMGHALYEQNIDSKFLGTPIGSGVSTSVHESMSRLWENFICKSDSFLNPWFEDIQKYLTNDISYKSFISKVLEVSNSSNRLEVDEVSYTIHIFIRYKIEKMLIEGTLNINDVPNLWNKMMKEYLNIEISNDSEGCLQDIHWAAGLIGYFPTYFLGTLYSAEIYQEITMSINQYEKKLNEKNYTEIVSWLKDKIYKHGSLYQPTELIYNVIRRKKISNTPFLNYLKAKYEI